MAEMETRHDKSVKQKVQHQWTKIWLRQQDMKQIEAGDFSSDVFTSFIDEASGLQSAFTVYYGFDPDLFRAAMIVYAVNVAGRLVLGLLAVVNVDWAEVQLVDGRAWRRVPGLLLMLIEPVSGNKLLESTLEARTRTDIEARDIIEATAAAADRTAADRTDRARAIIIAAEDAESAKYKLDREAKKLTNKANVEIVMALAEDVPELGLSAYWLATGGLDAMQTDSDASIVILSALISIFHMIKCIQRYRTIVQITKHAKTAGKETTPQCCTSDLDEAAKTFKLETYEIYGTNGFPRKGTEGFMDMQSF